MNVARVCRLVQSEQPTEIPQPGEMVLLFEALHCTLLQANKTRMSEQRFSLVSSMRLHPSRLVSEELSSPTAILNMHSNLASKMGVSFGNSCDGPQARKRISDYPLAQRTPRSYQNVEAQKRLCLVAEEHQKLQVRATKHPWEWPNPPWDRLYIEFEGPSQGKMILVIVDGIQFG